MISHFKFDLNVSACYSADRDVKLTNVGQIVVVLNVLCKSVLRLLPM